MSIKPVFYNFYNSGIERLNNIKKVVKSFEFKKIFSCLEQLSYSFWNYSTRHREFIYHYHERLTDSCDQKIYRLREVFFALAFAPTVDVRSAAFKKELSDYESQLDEFKNEIAHLPHQFRQPSLLRKDFYNLYYLYLKFKKNFNRLNLFFNVTERRIPQLPIHEEVKQLKLQYDLLNNDLDAYLNLQSSTIVDLLSTLFLTLITTSQIVPSVIFSEIYEDIKKIEELLISHTLIIPISYGQCIEFLRENIDFLNNRPILQKTSSVASKPLPLKNIGNSCYLDSSLQALCSLKEVQNRLKGDHLDKEIADINKAIQSGQLTEEERRNKEECKRDILNRKTLQNELSSLLDSYDTTHADQLSYVDYIVSILHGTSVLKFRNLLFQSQVHGEFRPENLCRQLDASSVFEALMTDVLKFTYDFQTYAATVDLPGRVFVTRKETNATLQIPIPIVKDETGKILEHAYEFKDLIHQAFQKEECIRNGRAFIPSEGIITDPLLVTPVADENASITPEIFHSWMRLKSLPDVLPIHLKRFAGDHLQRMKLNNQVILPEDLEIDLSPYIDKDPDDHSSTRYEIASYVVHQGFLNGGHYVAYVKQGDDYWYCNDSGPVVRKISREEFCQNKDAYMVVLRRIQ